MRQVVRALVMLLLVTPAAAQEKSMETMMNTPLGQLTSWEKVLVYRHRLKICFKENIAAWDDHTSDAKTVADYILQRPCSGELDLLIAFEKDANNLTEEQVRSQAYWDVLGSVLYSRAHPEKFGGPKN